MLEITPDEARCYMLGHLGLNAVTHPTGPTGVRALLHQLRHIQLDPLDPMGANHDMVVLARIDQIRKDQIFDAILPGHAFEHFAKERCLLPDYAFPYYRDHATETPWWQNSERLRRVPETVLSKVMDEIRERGPLTAAELSDHGKVKPLDWSGWKGTSKAGTMALEILWSQCRIVVTARKGKDKVFDIPERALPTVHQRPSDDFARWALLERVQAAGLLARVSGAHWSILSKIRTSGLPDQLIEEGLLEEVTITGANRRYLAPAGFRDQVFPELDERLRILGPLDPLIWDRKLVHHIFQFDYVWEVYKPEHIRRWGWYVHPLLHRGQMVGRLEGRIRGDILEIDRIWREKGRKLEKRALKRALKRHADACGAADFKLPEKILTD